MSNDPDTKPIPSIEPNAALEEPIRPSWKPLWWLLGGLALIIGLGELFLEFGMNLLELLVELVEHLWLVLIEAPEEFLEDLIAEWLDNHFPHDADRYSEIITAFGLMPLKVILVLLLLRWIWVHARSKLVPRSLAWLRRRVTEVRLAWQQLAWPYRVLMGLGAVGLLFILI